jgi:NTP pyrophosphatase (non-canonical NTP hydrolase)
MIGEVGSIVSLYKKQVLQGTRYAQFEKELAEEIGDLLWYVANLATREGISLSRIARENLAKARSLFDKGTINRFDATSPPDERFPRKLKVTFTERRIGRRTLVKISVRQINVGDVLTDNAHGQDGYRYHDAFHLAFCAVLGWSPVIRALLKRKRKSRPKTDEIEDGGRATVLEEAVASLVFDGAKSENDYPTPEAISFSLIRAVRSLTKGLEVRRATAKQWAQAIHLGYQMFQQLNKNRGGTLVLNLDKATIEYEPPRTAARKRRRRARR